MKKITALMLVCAMAFGLLLTGCTVERVDGGDTGTPSADNTDTPAATDTGNTGSGGNREVTVYSWGEYIDETLIDEFEETTGITVNYRTVPSNEDLYSLLQQGAISPDVVVPSDYMISQLIEEDMLQPLDYSKIPNFEKISDRFKNLSYDP